MHIRKIADDIVKRYGSRDPFAICRFLNIEIVEFHFCENIKGFFVRDNWTNQIIIGLNSKLHTIMIRTVLSHELGHAHLHPDISRYYIRKHTLFSTNKFEREANIFAAELLIPDEDLLEQLKEKSTLRMMSYNLNVPVELIKLKIQNRAFEGLNLYV